MIAGLVEPGETAGAEDEEPVESGREGTAPAALTEEDEEPLLVVAVTLREGMEMSFLPVEPRLFFCSLEERFVFDDEEDEEEDDGSSPSSLSEGIFVDFAVSSPEDVLETETLLDESTCAEAVAFPFDTTATAAGAETGVGVGVGARAA